MLVKKYWIIVLAIVAMSDGRCDLPDVAVANKLFEEGRYAEALKEYIACERAQIGERGFVILRETVCAEKTGDSVLRGIALKKLCAMEPVGNERKYVEAAYRMRFEKDVADSLHTGDLDRFLREVIRKFGGKGYAAEVAGTELKMLIRREEWNNVGRHLRQYPAAYPEGLTNAVDFIGAHLEKGRPITGISLERFSGLFACDTRLAEFVVGRCDKLVDAWRLWDCLGNMHVKRSDLPSAVKAYEKARSFPKCNAEELDYKIVSVKLSTSQGRRSAIEHALIFLRARSDSKWHCAMFRQTVKAMFDEKLFDEVGVLLTDRSICRDGYCNEEVKSIMAAITAERGKKKNAAQAKLAGVKADEALRNIGELRKRGDFAGAVTKCDELVKSAKKDSIRERAMRTAAEICFEDMADYKAAGARYGGLVRMFCKERRDLRLELRLVESMVIDGQKTAAKSRIAELRKVFNADMDELHMLDALDVLSGKVEPRKADEAARKLRRADVLFAAEEYSLALKSYKSAAGVKGVSRNVTAEALMQESRCLARLGKCERALSCYSKLERMLGRHPMSSDALMRMAVIYAGNLDDDRKAMAFYSRVENEYPGTENAERAMFYRLTLLMYVGEWKKAKELRKRFLRICKNDNARKTADAIYGEMIARRSFVIGKT